MKLGGLIIGFIYICVLSAVGQTATFILDLSIDEVDPLFGTSLDDDFTLIGSYEQSALTGIGMETLDVSDLSAGIELTFDFLGNVYTAADDPAIASPTFYFENGVFSGLFYRISLEKSSYSEDSFMILYRDQSLQYSLDGAGEYAGSYRIRSVSIPEVRPTFLLACASIPLIWIRRK